jgi:hypothetical protein
MLQLVASRKGQHPSHARSRYRRERRRHLLLAPLRVHGEHGHRQPAALDRHGVPLTLPDSDLPDRRRGAHPQGLARRVDARTATVAVVGLGYVGLPLLLAAARAGYPVIGVDADAGKIDALANGRSYITDVSNGDLGTLDAATLSVDPAVLKHADVVLLAVPTPLRDGTPDLGPVKRGHRYVGTRAVPRDAGGAGVDDMAGYDRGGSVPGVGGRGFAGRRRLRARLLTRAGGSRAAHTRSPRHPSWSPG